MTRSTATLWGKGENYALTWTGTTVSLNRKNMKMNYIMSYTKINSEWNKDKYEKQNQTNAFQHEKKTENKKQENIFITLRQGRGS